MCRLLATISSTPATVGHILGESGCRDFSGLASFHHDGWGAAWTVDSKTISRSISVTQADSDAKFTRHLEETKALGHLVHLRWASSGMSVTERNCHPFVNAGFAFMHNGNLGDIHRIDSMLTPESFTMVRGDTDSERYFSFVLQSIRTEGAINDGIIAAVRSLHKTFPKASLNAMLLHGDRIYIVNIHKGAMFDPPRTSVNQPLPWMHDDNHYYDLMWRRRGNSLAVASSGIRAGSWETLRDEGIFILDGGHGRPSISTLWTV